MDKPPRRYFGAFFLFYKSVENAFKNRAGLWTAVDKTDELIVVYLVQPFSLIFFSMDTTRSFK